MKSLILGFAALLATGSVFASTMPDTSVIHDKPGFFVHMDIDKVLASTDISQKCGIVPAQLKYLDHSGQAHELDYQVEGSGCTNDH